MGRIADFGFLDSFLDGVEAEPEFSPVPQKSSNWLDMLQDVEPHAAKTFLDSYITSRGEVLDLFKRKQQGKATALEQRLITEKGAFPTDLARQAAYYNSIIPNGKLKVGNQSYIYGSQPTFDRGVKQKTMGIFTSPDIPMVDWDWPDAEHQMNSQTTVKNLSDVVERVHDYTQANKDSRMRLYLTTGGVHAIDVGQRAAPKEFFVNSNSILNIDPYYINTVKSKEYADAEQYHMRVTPKQSRLLKGTDFISRFIGEMGQGRVDPSILSEVQVGHDLPAQHSVKQLANYGYPSPIPHSSRLAANQIQSIKSPSLRKLFANYQNLRL